MDVIYNRNSVLVLRDRYRPLMAVVRGSMWLGFGIYCILSFGQRAELNCRRDDSESTCQIQRQYLGLTTKESIIGSPLDTTIQTVTYKPLRGSSTTRYIVGIRTDSGVHRISEQGTFRVSAEARQNQIDRFIRDPEQESLTIVRDSIVALTVGGIFLAIIGIGHVAFLFSRTLYYFDTIHNRLVVERIRFGYKRREKFPLDEITFAIYEIEEISLIGYSIARTSIYFSDGSRIGSRWEPDKRVRKNRRDTVRVLQDFLKLQNPIIKPRYR